MSTKNQDGIIDLVILEGFRRINRKIQIISLPTNRGAKDLNLGNYDGQFLRSEIAMAKYKNAIKVSQPISRAKIVAIGLKSSNLTVKGWRSIISLELVYFRDAKLIASRIGKLPKAMGVQNYNNLVTMVLRKRADLGIVPSFLAEQWIKIGKNRELWIHSSALETVFAYLYISKKNGALEKPLSKAFKSMVQDGTLRKLCPTCGF
jgi:ABC-type amino acid transport substrate-binding protein